MKCVYVRYAEAASPRIARANVDHCSQAGGPAGAGATAGGGAPSRRDLPCWTAARCVLVRWVVFFCGVAFRWLVPRWAPAFCVPAPAFLGAGLLCPVALGAGPLGGLGHQNFASSCLTTGVQAEAG